MPSIFDRVQSALGNEPDGITPLDIVNLPDEQRRIMLWMLRDQEASVNGVTLDSLMARLQNAPADCRALLLDLSQNGWVIRTGEAPHERFKVNLRRKRGSTQGFGLWSILSDRIAQEPNDT
jgi:hypothetical protein